jgi:prepilin-type N-terminal cleavage/methylation domain-containing protein
MTKNNGFTLIELLVIVAIIALLASAILVGVSRSKEKARINSAKTSIRSVLPAIIACKNNGGTVNNPDNNNDICSSNVGLTGAKWQQLSYGYTYILLGSIYNSDACNFQININNDTTESGNNFLTCSCLSQICK